MSGVNKIGSSVELEEKPFVSDYLDIPVEEVIEAGTEACPGCGILLGLRLAMKIIGMNSRIIASGSHANVFGLASKVPYVAVKKLKIPYLRKEENDSADAGEMKEKEIVLCFDGTNDIDDIIDAAGKCDLVISSVIEPGKNLAKAVSSGVEYAATASISHPVDYLDKVKEALNHKTSFIELLALCPGMAFSKLEPSNTIEAARMAVESGLFPLYNIKSTEDGKKIKLTHTPVEMASVAEYYRLAGIVKSDEEIGKEQSELSEKINLLKKGKF